MASRWSTADIPDQRGRRALVTGANSGIGLHTALELARRGAEVVLTSRDVSRGRAAQKRLRAEAPGSEPRLVVLDLADLDSVSAAAAQVTADGPLDLLVNNAGVMAVPERRTTAQGFELQFGTNHLGHFALTGLLLPGMRQRPGSRVVTVSSNLHRGGVIRLDDLHGQQAYSQWGAYNASKLANAMFTLELARRLSAANAETISVGAHPGFASTALQKSGPRLGGGSVQALVLGLVTRVVAQSAAAGALPTLRAASDPTATSGDYYGPGGRGERRGRPRLVAYAAQAHDEQVAADLWAESERLTGVAYLHV